MYSGDGQGLITLSQTLEVTGNQALLRGATAMDANNDGLLDLAVRAASQTGVEFELFVQLNGELYLTETIAGISTQSLAAGDIDGDGASDLVALSANELRWFRNNVNEILVGDCDNNSEDDALPDRTRRA